MIVYLNYYVKQGKDFLPQLHVQALEKEIQECFNLKMWKTDAENTCDLKNRCVLQSRTKTISWV